MESQHKDGCFVDDLNVAPADPQKVKAAFDALSKVLENNPFPCLGGYAGGFNIHESLLPEDLRGKP